MGPHTAALGMRFYTGNMFPKAYKNAIIIARHGSWNKSHKEGGDVVVVKLNKDGTMKSMEPFITGFLEDNKYVGRPVDVHADEGRLAAGLRRLERRRLPHHLRQAEGCRAVRRKTPDRGQRRLPPISFWNSVGETTRCVKQ